MTLFGQKKRIYSNIFSVKDVLDFVDCALSNQRATKDTSDPFEASEL
jgi:hypothetical protein